MRRENGRKYFYQWEVNQQLIVDEACTIVHFANGTTEKSLSCEVIEEGEGEGKVRLVNVPNILLQTPAELHAYAWDGASVVAHTVFSLVARPKPAEYAYTETDVKQYEMLESELIELAEKIRDHDHQIIEMQTRQEAQSSIQSQGRSAKYSFTSTGWKRVLNIIRTSGGVVNFGIAQSYPLYMSQATGICFSGFVKYKNDTTTDKKPVLYQLYNNIFGENDAMQNPGRITAVRIGYPDPKQANYNNGTSDALTNPINCYLDVLVEFDKDTLKSKSISFNLNYSGFSDSHNCVPITEETDATGTGIYGESLSFHNFYLREGAMLYVPDGMAYLPGYLRAGDGTKSIGIPGLSTGQYGFKTNTAGTNILLAMATNADIDSRTSTYKPIVPSNLEYAVRSVGDNRYVQDVQIGGNSIVTDGVANFRVNSSYGTSYVNSANGLILATYPATETHISARNSKYMQIATQNYDYAVKTAMCDGKGAAWTSDEQIAAQKRMGIDNVGSKLDALWKLNEGFSYDFISDTAAGYAKTVPAGCKFASIEHIGGQTEVVDGESVSADVQSVKEQGFNWWDETWEIGALNVENGNTVNDTGCFRSKDFIPVLPSTNYYFCVKTETTGQAIRVVYYDANKAFIKSPGSDTNSIKQTPENCYFVKFYSRVSPTVYNGGICINVSSTEQNGTYKPYHTKTYTVPDAVRELTGYGWSVGDVCNAIERTESGWQFVQRVGMFELTSETSLSLSSYDDTTGIYLYQLVIPSNGTPSDMPNICNKFQYFAFDNRATAWKTDSAIVTNNNGLTRIASTMDMESLTAFVLDTPTVIHYVLENPVVTDITDLMADFPQSFAVEAGGTITFENAASLPVPNTVKYLRSLKEVSA